MIYSPNELPNTALRCPDCGVTSLSNFWSPSEVFCDDCGEHPAATCPSCDERVDLIFNDLWDLIATDLPGRALTFAAAAHAGIDQRRKYTNEPYIVHPIAVAEIVASVDHTEEMLAAAFLHDTVEDTPVTIERIETEFGPVVAELVGWLTDVSKPEDGNRKVRKALDREHTAKAPPAAKTIKLADLIDNTLTIKERDPDFWRPYRHEKLALLEVLKEGDQALWVRARAQCD